MTVAVVMLQPLHKTLYLFPAPQTVGFHIAWVRCISAEETETQETLKEVKDKSELNELNELFPGKLFTELNL